MGSADASGNIRFNWRIIQAPTRLIDDVVAHELIPVRLGRNLRHLVMLLDDWHSRGIAFVALGEGIDTSTPAGRLVAGVLGSIEFERARIQERVRADRARVRAQGRRLGRKPCGVTNDRFAAVSQLSTRETAKQLGVSHTVVARCRAVNKTLREAITETSAFPASA